MILEKQLYPINMKKAMKPFSNYLKSNILIAVARP